MTELWIAHREPVRGECAHDIPCIVCGQQRGIWQDDDVDGYETDEDDEDDTDTESEFVCTRHLNPTCSRQCVQEHTRRQQPELAMEAGL